MSHFHPVACQGRVSPLSSPCISACTFAQRCVGFLPAGCEGGCPVPSCFCRRPLDCNHLLYLPSTPLPLSSLYPCCNTRQSCPGKQLREHSPRTGRNAVAAAACRSRHMASAYGGFMRPLITPGMPTEEPRAIRAGFSEKLSAAPEPPGRGRTVATGANRETGRLSSFPAPAFPGTFPSHYHLHSCAADRPSRFPASRLPRPANAREQPHPGLQLPLLLPPSGQRVDMCGVQFGGAQYEQGGLLRHRSASFKCLAPADNPEDPSGTGEALGCVRRLPRRADGARACHRILLSSVLRSCPLPQAWAAPFSRALT